MRIAPKTVNAGLPTDTAVGDFDAAFAAAPVRVDQTYTTPYQFSQPMEPHNCLAVWDGDVVTFYVSTQIVAEAHSAIAATLRTRPRADPRRRARYVGGGFGSKLGIHAETILAVMAARELEAAGQGRGDAPADLPRSSACAPATRQRVRLGADRDGR